MTLIQPDVETLKRFLPLEKFNDYQLQDLANQLIVENASRGQKLIELGSIEDCSLFVLQGELELKARDGKIKEMNIAANEKLNPVAQLRPSMYDVIAKTDLRFVKIKKSMLTEFACQAESEGEDISVHLLDEEEETSISTMQLYQDLMADKVSLPSLPQVALKIQQAFERRDELDLNKVAAILMTDPAITAKLIKVANSPLYQGSVSIDTIPLALNRLGLDTIYKLVMAYAANELFTGLSDGTRERMQKLWAHSRKTAAISHLLADQTGLFNPEQAMLAGLIHDLGVIVVLNYIEQSGEDLSDRARLEQVIQIMRAQFTGTLLRKWRFSSDMILVAEECEEWFRNPGEQADLCDLVLVAQYHALLSDGNSEGLPPLSMLPAMSKLDLGPKESISIIRESKAKIAEIERVLD